jgi:hypothetical protein
VDQQEAEPMKRIRAPRTSKDAAPALPEDVAPALEAYLRTRGVASLILVSIPPGHPDDDPLGGTATEAGVLDGCLVHLEHWQDIPRTRTALAEHPAVAEVADAPAADGSICWSLRFSLKAPGPTPNTPGRG